MNSHPRPVEVIEWSKRLYDSGVCRFHVLRRNTILSCTRRYNVIVRLRLGRWYEFRLAALNEHGIRGYSTPSPRFQLKESTFLLSKQLHIEIIKFLKSAGPKNPSPPRDFTIAVPPQLTANNTVYVKVIWRQPRTDYVIEKYKISWALHLQSDNGTLIESLWYNDAYIQEVCKPGFYFKFYVPTNLLFVAHSIF